MIRIIKKIFLFLRRKIFVNKYKRSFKKKIKIAPEGCDLSENVLAFRYLCHHLDKAIKNKYDIMNIRGFEKYKKAIKILHYLENTKWIESPDIEWSR